MVGNLLKKYKRLGYLLVVSTFLLNFAASNKTFIIMARKYTHYESIVDGEDTQVFERYSEACMHYGQGDAPKTLWGVTAQGEYSVIFSMK